MDVREATAAGKTTRDRNPGGAPGQATTREAAPGEATTREAGPDTGERPRTKAAQREATVAALIDAARELFAQRGYANVGTEEIVQAAGVTRGALYHHFRAGKEELFRAVLVQVSAEMVRTVTAEAGKQDDPWDALVVGIDAFLDACTKPEFQRIVLVDGPSVLGWDLWRAMDADYTGLSLIEGVLQRAIDGGKLLPQPATALAHVIVGAVQEAAMVVAEAEDPRTAREEMGATVRRLLEGLRGPMP
jgi:AcrR family transcriptional regulator